MTVTTGSNNKPSRRPNRLEAVPRKGEVYWCEYPPSECLHLPEFWKRRPVVIISRKVTRKGVATIVPLTSKTQTNSRVSVRIESPIDGRDAWAICNHVTTVAVSRLLPARRKSGYNPSDREDSENKPSVSSREYKAMRKKVINNLATP